MGSELVQQLLDAGFPAAKPARDNELSGIPTLEELIAAVEQIHAGFRLSLKRINPDEWEAHSGFVSIDCEARLLGKTWRNCHRSIGKTLARSSRGIITSGQLFVRTLPHNTERRPTRNKVTGRAASF